MKNLQVWVTGMYKVENSYSLEMMRKVFPIDESIYEHDLRNTSDFVAHRIKTVRYGSESLPYLGPRLWNILPDEYHKIRPVNDLKAKIRSWMPEKCPCRLCKMCIPHVSFI